MRRIVPFAAVLCLSACAGLGADPAARSGAGAAASASGGDGGAALPVVDIPYTKYRLANGLTVIVHEDHKAPVVAINVRYHVGSKDEPEHRHGFAHLFEHLMFNGSEHYNDEWFRALEPVGATEINGNTDRDRTNYFETVPVAALDRALWLESDRMGYLTGAIDQAKLDEQRGVVLNEKRQRENAPYGKVFELIARESFPPSHPYSWTTIGSVKDLNAATLADVKAWFKQYYGPNNAVLTIAGDVDPATLRAKIEKYFGEIPPGPAITHAKAAPAPLAAEKRFAITDEAPLPRLYMVWNLPGDGDRDAVLLGLLADALAGSREARLSRRLVHEERIAQSVQVGVQSSEIASQFMIVATASPGADLSRIEREIREELARAITDGPSADELRRARIGAYTGSVAGLDKVGGNGGKTNLLGGNELFHGDPAHYRLEMDWLNAATPADISAAARRWLGDGKLVVEVQPAATLAAAATKVDRSKPPEPQAPAVLKLPPVQHATLSNGLKVWFAERHNVPLVQLNLVVDAGRAADAGGRPGTAGLTMDMLDEGAGTLDALEISRRQGELGATIGAGSDRDSSMVSLSTLRATLPDALALYAEVLLHPSFRAEDLARLKQRLLAGIQQERTQPAGVARRVLSGALFGASHPYAFIGSGLASDVEAITPDDLKRFHQRWLRPDNATLVVVGDTTLAELLPLLERQLGGWKAPAEAKPVKAIAAVKPAAGGRVLLIDKPDASQTLVIAANVIAPGHDTDRTLLGTVNDAFGGLFISRLNLNLREDKHWTYGARSQFTAALGPQSLLASANVERDHTADAMLEMRKELRGLADGSKPLSAAEIAAAKQSQVQGLPGAFESMGELAGGLAQLVQFGLPDDHWNRLVPKIEAYTPADLAAGARQLIQPDALVWVVVGDLAKIEPSVRKLALGQVEVLDADGNRLR